MLYLLIFYSFFSHFPCRDASSYSSSFCCSISFHSPSNVRNSTLALFFYLIEFFINWVSCPCDSAFIYKWCSFSFFIHSLSLRKYWFLEWPLAHVSVKKNYVENNVSKTSMPSPHHPTFWSHRVNKRRGGRTGIRLHVLLFYREALDYYYHFMPL